MKTEIENKILVQIKNIKQNFRFVKMYENDELVPRVLSTYKKLQKWHQIKILIRACIDSFK